jgi:hypothetical protein
VTETEATRQAAGQPAGPAAVVDATVFDAAVVDDLIDALRQQAALLSRNEGGLRDDPLSYAWLSCLEAASTVGRVLSAQPTAAATRHHPATGTDTLPASASASASTEDLQEAYAATRAAAVTVRFSLFGRRGEQAGPVGPEAAAPPA